MGIDIGLFMAIVGGFITVFTFFYKLIIFPLSEAINELKNMIAELRAEIKAEREKRVYIDSRVIVLEEKVRHIEESMK
jgi:F0F1-type ATP synthase membrane subunit b/b'